MSAKLNYICIQDLYNGSPKINVREYGRGHQKRTIQQTVAIVCPLDYGF
jgi:hypothetical protein